MMEANEFIAKLKAETTEKDAKMLDKVYENYKSILTNLPAKDRGLFSLNVLCTLCRNLDKFPSWRDNLDCRIFLSLSIDCVRETRAMSTNDRVKTIACLYHIHKHVVRQIKHVPPELVLKISFMPFEVESKHLLLEYSKTYWNILVDRMTYIEKLKHIPISKLLPKLTEDVLKVIDIFDTVQFISTILVFLVKKLHYLYTNCSAKELNDTYVEIFKSIASKDLGVFKNLSRDVTLDIYVKLNECFYIIMENSSKINYKNFPLDKIVNNCITILEDSPDFFYIFQTFHINSFHYIFTESDTRTRLKGLLLSMEATEKIGYTTAMMATYPFLNNFLRLFIEYKIKNVTTHPWKNHFDIPTQEITLKIILLLMKKLKNCKQLLKCENCNVQSGLHDALRTSFLLKKFITLSLSQKLIITNLQSIILDIINEQNKILSELKEIGCSNYDKCFRQNQTDIHNSAITLNKAQYYEFSIKLFDIYLNIEIKQSTIDCKNVSRALYNKSICELDSTMYKNAIIDGFLSLCFSSIDGESEKYMSLIMDIKCKELKAKAENESDNELQLFSVFDAMKFAIENKLYGEITEYLKRISIRDLLLHEFKMYCKLWPSIAPIGGVWKSLYELYSGMHSWINVNKEEILWCLYEIIMETASVVRTIHSEYFENIVKELLEKIQQFQSTPDLSIIHSALLFLNTEYTLAATSKKYGWKSNEPIQTSDPDQIPCNRTLPQEHGAIVQALKALDILIDVMKNLDKVSKTSCLRSSLPIYQVFVYQFLHLSKTVQALQLAYICCKIAEYLNDVPTYIINAGIILSNTTKQSVEIDDILMKSCQKWKELNEEDLEISIILICDTSIYYCNIGSIGMAAKLLQLAQNKILSIYENTELNVEMAVGRVMEAQIQLSKHIDKQTNTQTLLSAVNGVQRHYLGISSSGSKWSYRRSYTLRLRHLTCKSTVAACHAARTLLLYRRAAATGAAGLLAAGAAGRAKVYGEITDIHSGDDAQIKIDNRLKHILGLQPTNEIHSNFAPKMTDKAIEDIEPMRDIFKRNPTSPSMPCITIPAFKIPEFFFHENCDCYACSEPLTFLITCRTSALEAALYFRNNELDIARNYFDGATKLIELTQNRFRQKKYVNYEKFIVENVFERHLNELKEIEVENLIEMSFFELKTENFDGVDEYIVRLHEIIKGLCIDKYINNEICNLIVASAEIRNKTKKSIKIENLEEDFEKLDLNSKVLPKTPETKAKIPKLTNKVVKDEEVFKKRKVIKLNLEEDDDFEVKTTKVKSEFKIPVPKLTKPSLELATPVTTRSKPKLLITQPSTDTPTTKNVTNEFFTPSETPEQFFTPMTSIKTYSKKNLRQNIVKKLEDEFSTPKQTDKKLNKNENVLSKIPKKTTKIQNENLKPENVGKIQTKVKKDVLRRATSPGKLPKATISEKLLKSNDKLPITSNNENLPNSTTASEKIPKSTNVNDLPKATKLTEKSTIPGNQKLRSSRRKPKIDNIDEN